MLITMECGYNVEMIIWCQYSKINACYVEIRHGKHIWGLGVLHSLCLCCLTTTTMLLQQ